LRYPPRNFGPVPSLPATRQKAYRYEPIPSASQGVPNSRRCDGLTWENKKKKKELAPLSRSIAPLSRARPYLTKRPGQASKDGSCLLKPVSLSRRRDQVQARRAEQRTERERKRKTPVASGSRGSVQRIRIVRGQPHRGIDGCAAGLFAPGAWTLRTDHQRFRARRSLPAVVEKCFRKCVDSRLVFGRCPCRETGKSNKRSSLLNASDQGFPKGEMALPAEQTKDGTPGPAQTLRHGCWGLSRVSSDRGLAIDSHGSGTGEAGLRW